MSHGIDRYKVEIRATAIKGLLRNLYRICSVEVDTHELFKQESKLFGDAINHSSPISLQITNRTEKDKGMKLLLHDNKSKDAKNNPQVRYFNENTTFTLVVRGKNQLSKKEFDYYKGLLRLSTYLCGIGQRSRRARGVISFEDELCENKEKLMEFICRMLNEISPQTFHRNGNVITNNFSELKNINRPVIEKIELGQHLEQSVMSFLRVVDQASHASRIGAFGNQIYATGNAGKPRLASSLIVSLVKTKDQKIYPIYVFLKPVIKKKDKEIIDNRDEFVNLLKGDIQ